jgi:hypothetical protein
LFFDIIFTTTTQFEEETLHSFPFLEAFQIVPSLVIKIPLLEIK